MLGSPKKNYQKVIKQIDDSFLSQLSNYNSFIYEYLYHYKYLQKTKLLQSENNNIFHIYEEIKFNIIISYRIILNLNFVNGIKS